jgi:hypothetical protein
MISSRVMPVSDERFSPSIDNDEGWSRRSKRSSWGLALDGLPLELRWRGRDFGRVSRGPPRRPPQGRPEARLTLRQKRGGASIVRRPWRFSSGIYGAYCGTLGGGGEAYGVAARQPSSKGCSFH